MDRSGNDELVRVGLRNDPSRPRTFRRSDVRVASICETRASRPATSTPRCRPRVAAAGRERPEHVRERLLHGGEEVERGRRRPRDDVHGDHRVRLFELRGGSKRVRYRSSASSAGRKVRRERVGAPPPRAARRRGSSRGSRSERAIPHPGSRTRAGPAADPQQRLQLQNVLRERVGAGSCRRARSVNWSVPGARPTPRSILLGCSASSVPNCSAITSGG